MGVRICLANNGRNFPAEQTANTTVTSTLMFEGCANSPCTIKYQTYTYRPLWQVGHIGVDKHAVTILKTTPVCITQATACLSHLGEGITGRLRRGAIGVLYLSGPTPNGCSLFRPTEKMTDATLRLPKSPRRES